MNISTYAYSNIGGRNNNEDYCLYNNNIWVLADGLGGHDCGEVASKAASESIDLFVRKEGLCLEEQFLKRIIDEANSAVIKKQHADEKIGSMKTTIVFALTDGNVLKYANVGDSRFYYFKNGKVFIQSEDHSVSWGSAKMGDISFDDIRGDDDRNKLLKVLGNSEKISVKIPSDEILLEKGDAFLLCSDGFWEYVYETEMEIDLSKSETPEEWLKFMAKRIILKTHNNGNDNFTAICAMVE